MRNHTYTTSNNERMDGSFLNYFSTISLSLMCYAFFNPKFVFELSMFLAYGIVNTTVTSYNIYNTYITSHCFFKNLFHKFYLLKGYFVYIGGP